MKTLVLKHNGHEAHVPYELPDSIRFDCFVPEHGLCVTYVDLRAETIEVLEVREVLPAPIGESSLPESLCTHPAVLEQAGDVCAVFERALSGKTLLPDYQDEKAEPDSRILSTIAEMALLESDLHTAWSRLPECMRAETRPPPDGSDPETLASVKALASFIEGVLVPRAQDLATAAAKRREAEWEEEQAKAKLANYEATWMDALTKRSKEGA